MMRKFSFAVLILSFFISFPTFAAASGGAGTEDLPDRSVYAKGCLPDPYYHAHAVPYREDPLPGILSLSFGSIRGFDVPRPLPPSSMLESITPVRDQGSLGSCTAFAVVAALECLVPGVSFSEAELYIRAKTKGGSSQAEDGCSLSTYIPLVREGAVEARYFVKYERYLNRIKNAKMRLDFLQVKMKLDKKASHGHERLSTEEQAVLDQQQAVILTGSLDYRTSIESLKVWNSSLKPRWREETYTIRVDDDVPGVVRLLWWLNPIATVGRTVFDDHHSALQHVETRTRTVIDPDSYHPQKFDMKPIKIIPPGLSKDPLYYLKAALNDKKPLVASVRLFKMPKEEIYLWQKLWDAGPESRVEMPPKEAIHDPKKDHHAICLYGYDDTKQAFRLKNSWIDSKTGKPWADNGFAWISYEYIQHHTNAVYVIKKL